MDRTLKKSGSGFSLLEIILAMGVIAVAILGLMGVFISGVGLSSRSRDLAAATELGQAVMERIKYNAGQAGFGYIPSGNFRFNGKAPDTPIGTPQFPPPPYPTTEVNNQEFFISVSGEELSPTLKEIQVVVTWQNSGIVLETRLHP